MAISASLKLTALRGNGFTEPDRMVSNLKEGARGWQSNYLSSLLALQPDGFEILDAIVVSLLVVEYNLRMKETRYHNGDGRATFMTYF